MAFDEAQLVTRAQQGDRDAFATLYDHALKPMYQFLYYKSFNKEVAEDLTSQVFLKALERLDRFTYRGDGSFLAWLYVIARNTHTDHLRRTMQQAYLEDDGNVPEVRPSAQRVEAAAELELARQALNALPEAQREVVVMRVWQDMPYKDIAAATGKSKANCKMIFSRAIATLRTRMPLTALILLLLHV